VGEGFGPGRHSERSRQAACCDSWIFQWENAHLRGLGLGGVGLSRLGSGVREGARPRLAFRVGRDSLPLTEAHFC
jgi:hypothetical protein